MYRSLSREESQFLTARCGGGGGLVAKSCPTLAIPWIVIWQASLSMGFSREEYWSGLPFSSPAEGPGTASSEPLLPS